MNASFGTRLINAILDGDEQDQEHMANVFALVGQQYRTMQIARNLEALAQRVAARAYGTAGARPYLTDPTSVDSGAKER